MNQNMIRLSNELYNALRKQALKQHKTLDTMVSEWLAERLDLPTDGEVQAAFSQEVAAFEDLIPTLQRQYANQYVAICRGQVVASGDNKIELLKEVYGELGPIICYIEKIATTVPRTVRIPSAWVANT
jgi:hypothetical protein